MAKAMAYTEKNSLSRPAATKIQSRMMIDVLSVGGALRLRLISCPDSSWDST